MSSATHMTALLVWLFVTIIGKADDEVLVPECNYAATSAYFYPIGGCESYRTMEDDGNWTISSFEYICTSDNGIAKRNYDNLDCSGDASHIEIKLEDDLQSYECGLNGCSYSTLCSYYSCGGVNDTTCAKCDESDDSTGLHCRPLITNECFGIVGELLQQFQCNNGLLTENYHADSTNCSSSGDADWNIQYGGNDASTYCFDGSYWTAECVAAKTTAYPVPTVEGTETEDSAFTYSLAVIISSVFVAAIWA